MSLEQILYELHYPWRFAGADEALKKLRPPEPEPETAPAPRDREGQGYLQNEQGTRFRIRRQPKLSKAARKRARRANPGRNLRDH